MRLVIVIGATLVLALCSFTSASAAVPFRGGMSGAAGALSDTILVKKKGVPGWVGRGHCPPGHWKKGWC